jgi:hypothetical protein
VSDCFLHGHFPGTRIAFIRFFLKYPLFLAGEFPVRQGDPDILPGATIHGTVNAVAGGADKNECPG